MSAADKRREYLEKEREIMKIQDKIDKEVAREKKKELKRKRKEREREVSGLFPSTKTPTDVLVATTDGNG